MRRAVNNSFIPDYVLTDTWFFCKQFLDAVNKLGFSIKLISMAKIGSARFKVMMTGQLLNPQQIIKLYERKYTKHSRKYKADYISLQAEYQGIRVKIFLIRFGRNTKLRMLVSSDLNINFNKLMEVYQIRWTIEVFFKESKQYLQLGKSQSQDFDGQIADTTLSLIRYLLLSFYERTRHGFTIGGLFRELKQTSIEENLLADINDYFFELIKLFSQFAGVDIIEFYSELLTNPQGVKIIDILNMRKMIEKQAA